MTGETWKKPGTPNTRKRRPFARFTRAKGGVERRYRWSNSIPQTPTETQLKQNIVVPLCGNKALGPAFLVWQWWRHFRSTICQNHSMWHFFISPNVTRPQVSRHWRCWNLGKWGAPPSSLPWDFWGSTFWNFWRFDSKFHSSYAPPFACTICFGIRLAEEPKLKAAVRNRQCLFGHDLRLEAACPWRT